MARTPTRLQPTLTVESIQRWRLIDDAPQLQELALHRRTLREQRKLLLAREREQLAVLATAHKAKQAKLAMLGEDVSTYPAFDPATVKDVVLVECREQLLAVDDALLQAETVFEAEAAPVLREYAALQKARMTELMDRALEALDVLEDVGEAGERLCMQSWGVLGSYVTTSSSFRR